MWNKIKKIFLFIFGYCKCGCFFVYPRRRRLNTAYVNDEQNYIISCLSCYRETIEYYKERWHDYYSSLM